jgi:dTDP-4-dehydrorhamnose 3,5-epimerase
VLFQPTDLAGVIVVEPDVHRDDRGFFLEVYHARKYAGGGIDAVFVQDNHSRSARGILRGLHGQRRHPQGKLVRAIDGEIFDVAVDVRRGSPSFGRWIGVVLSGDNSKQLYVPPGYLHGFCVLSERADVEYKCTDFYDRADEVGVRWDDPAIGIEWPITDPVVSAKDSEAPLLSEIFDLLPVFDG